MTVNSHYELASVRASVGRTQADLSYLAESGHWEGTLSLQSVPRDSLQLLVTARDVNGSATDAFVTVVHDRAPMVTIAAPDSGTVARPSIDLSVDCTDDDPGGCRSLVVTARSADRSVPISRTLMSGQSHVNGTVSLSDFDGGAVSLVFTATDSRGQTVQASRTVYVESSTSLVELATVDGTVMDVRGDHLLYRDMNGMIALRTITSGDTELIYADTATGVRSAYGFVTSGGAILAVGIPSPPYARVLEWRGGTPLDLGGLDGNTSLRISGDYAIFSNGNTLTRRDLGTGTNTTVAVNAGNTDNGVAPNGDVAFWSSDYRVYRYHDGTATLLTPDDGTGQLNTGPVTDGVNVVYVKQTPCCTTQTYAIVLHDGTGETVLAPERSQQPIAGLDYAANGGWVAFTRPGTGEVLQVWTRSPTGELRQVSALGTASRISALASDGIVIFQSGSRRYLAVPGGAPQEFMSGLGTVLWRDGRFIVLIGRTAFAVAR